MGSPGPPAKKRSSLSRFRCYLRGPDVQITAEQGGTFSTTRLLGKRQEGEMSAPGHQWKWKNPNQKKNQEGKKIYFGDNGTGVSQSWPNAVLGLNLATTSFFVNLEFQPSILTQEWGAQTRAHTRPHGFKMKRFQDCISHLSLIFGFPLNCIVVNGCSA